MPTTCERIEGCDGGVCWYAAYYETMKDPAVAGVCHTRTPTEPYIEVQFDNL